MIFRFLVTLLLLILLVTEAQADLTFPATFEIIEEAPREFSLVISSPMVKGRYMKLKPVVPETFEASENLSVFAGPSALTHSWRVLEDPATLPGQKFGLDGLLGTAVEAKFFLKTLDGRQHQGVLRGTRSSFVVPPLPEIGQLARGAGRDGLRRMARNWGLWILFSCILLSSQSATIRRGLAIAVGCAFIFGLGINAELSRIGLSDLEFRWVQGFLLLGGALGVISIVASIELTRSLLSDDKRSRINYIVSVLASAWIFYQGAGVLYHYGPNWLNWGQRFWQYLYHTRFAPFESDWAMGLLRLPFLSIVTLSLMILAIIKIKCKCVRRTITGILFFLTFLILPLGNVRISAPFLGPRALSARQVKVIVEPMLSEIYHCLNLNDENETYDRLAEQVSEKLVSNLYLDSRRRLESGTRDGATVTVRQIQVDKVGEPEFSDDKEVVFSCSWNVTARITHWQHTHDRRNVYEGDLRLVVEDDAWKLSDLYLRSEDRNVVPGSFQSR